MQGGALSGLNLKADSDSLVVDVSWATVTSDLELYNEHLYILQLVTRHLGALVARAQLLFATAHDPSLTLMVLP
jgi:hypothetical protein